LGVKVSPGKEEMDHCDVTGCTNGRDGDSPTCIEHEGQYQRCGYCGRRNASVRTHSGIEECSQCWDYRKLDRPAALHWAKVTSREEGFLSNVDMYDFMDYFPKCGLSKEEAMTMIGAAQKLERYSRYAKENGPEHTWSDEVQAWFENETRGRVRR